MKNFINLIKNNESYRIIASIILIISIFGLFYVSVNLFLGIVLFMAFGLSTYLFIYCIILLLSILLTIGIFLLFLNINHVFDKM